jgi:hypothetical protein
MRSLDMASCQVAKAGFYRSRSMDRPNGSLMNNRNGLSGFGTGVSHFVECAASQIIDGRA